MCGRYALNQSPADLTGFFGLAECVDFAPHYNIAPGADIPVIRERPEGGRALHLLHWGLIPHWAKDPAIGDRLNNARGESVAEKPSFRDAFRRRRCLIPASGFYEWQAQADGKQPYFIRLRSAQPMAMGGLWESWRTAEGGVVRSCCIVTTAANETMADIHGRMPLILDAGDWNAWLSAPADAALELVRPCPAEALTAWPVSRRVNRAREDDADLIAPLAS